MPKINQRSSIFFWKLKNMVSRVFFLRKHCFISFRKSGPAILYVYNIRCLCTRRWTCKSNFIEIYWVDRYLRTSKQMREVDWTPCISVFYHLDHFYLQLPFALIPMKHPVGNKGGKNIVPNSGPARLGFLLFELFTVNIRLSYFAFSLLSVFCVS